MPGARPQARGTKAGVDTQLRVASPLIGLTILASRASCARPTGQTVRNDLDAACVTDGNINFHISEEVRSLNNPIRSMYKENSAWCIDRRNHLDI